MHQLLELTVPHADGNKYGKSWSCGCEQLPCRSPQTTRTGPGTVGRNEAVVDNIRNIPIQDHPIYSWMGWSSWNTWAQEFLFPSKPFSLRAWKAGSWPAPRPDLLSKKRSIHTPFVRRSVSWEPGLARPINAMCPPRARPSHRHPRPLHWPLLDSGILNRRSAKTPQ